MLALEIIIGFIAGFLGGQFGVGGALLTTPAIRLILQQKALIAVGTPLPIMIPTVLAGLYNYKKNNLIDIKKGLIIGLVGALSSVFGAYLTPLIGGSTLLIITAVLIGLVSLKFFSPSPQSSPTQTPRRARGARPTTFIVGLIAGFLSGLLGLGGGFIIIPALTILMGMEIKKAFGTSLLAILFIAIPGSIAHYLLGNIDLKLAFFITLGVIPGAYLGSKVTIKLPEKTVRILFGFYLLINALLLAVNELILF